MATIRRETSADGEAIYDVNEAAFGRDAEAELVETLRHEGALLLSLVAEVDGRVVGHSAFSAARVVYDDESASFDTVALGPMAVLPQFQKRGIGSQLVRAALQMLREQGADHVFVLGHSAYYARFGFQPARRFGIRCQFDVPPEAFMVRLFAERTVKQRAGAGILHYHSAFAAV